MTAEYVNRPDLPRCGGRKKVGDDFCLNPAGWATDHLGYGRCALHWGATLAGRTDALRDLGREMAAKFGGVADTNESAEEILIAEVRRAAAFVRYLEEQIGQWQAAKGRLDPHGTGLPELLDRFEGKAIPTEQREWLVMYRDERKHLAAVAKSCIDAGISQRMVEMAQRVSDQDAMLLATAIKVILERLGLSNTQAALVPQIVPDVLRRVVAGEVLA